MREDFLRIKIGSLAKIQNGYAFKSQEYVGAGLRIIRIANVQSGKIIDRDPKFYSIDRLKEFKEYNLEEDDFLISLTGNVGRVGRINKQMLPALLNQRVGKFNLLTNAISKDYFYYFLISRYFVNQVIKSSKGVAQLNTSSQKIENIEIPLTSFPEQRAIVSKIEELFSDLDKGIADLNLAKDQLKIYRQAVLKKAFEGRLNSNIAQNDKGEERFPKGWKWIKSGELFSLVTSGSRGWAKYYSDKGAIFIRITNLNFNTLDLDLSAAKIQYVNPPELSEGIRTKIQEGDFLFSITGYLGMFAIAPNLKNAFVNQHVSLCRPKKGFNKRYVGYWIISQTGGIYHLNKNQKGAVKAGLNLDDLKSFPIPIPSSIEEQHQIVREIETRLSVCDKVEQSITESLEKAKALRQSILKKAFEGTLLSAAEIEKCKVAPDYEPASVLLERIKADKKK